MEKASTGVAETAADVEIDARLRDDLRVDILKLKGLLGENVSLDKVKMYQYINECAVVAQKTAIVQVALECADTDGTGSKLNCSMTLQRLSRDLLADMDAEHVAAVREALKDKRAALSQKLDILGMRRYRESDKAVSSFIEARKLRSMLMFAPFSLSEDQVSSIMRFLGVKSEDGDSVRIPEFMRSFCPILDQQIFTMINSKVIEKYGSLKTAFDSKGGSKNGKISRQQLSELLREMPLEPTLSLSEEQDMINLADADGSGTIEYQEFQIIFGAGEMLSRARQENYNKLQSKGSQAAAVRTDSISSSETPTSTLGPEERVAETMLGSRVAELRAALKEADRDGKGSLDDHTLLGAFNKLGLGLSAQDMSTLLSKALISPKAPVDYEKFLQQLRERLSTAATIEEAEAEVVEALRDLVQRRGEGKMSLVKAFQIIDNDLNAGKGKGKITSSQLAKTVASLRVALSSALVTKLVKAADSERKDGVVNYADFVRMLGASSSKLRGLKDGMTLRRGSGSASSAAPATASSPSPLLSPSPTAAGAGGSTSLSWAAGSESAVLDDLSDEMEEEIREVIKGKYETMTNAFRNFDKTNKGSMTREEMLDGLKRLSLPISDKQFGKIIKRADADGGGTIDFNEFKAAFETGGRAEAKREGDKQKKAEDQLRRERKLEAASAAQIPEEVGNVDPKAETFLWVTLQKRYSSIPEAFAFLKGRSAGKHAHLMSEPELCNGLLRLNLVEQLVSTTDSEAIAKLLRNPSYDTVSMIQKKDILMAAKGLSAEAARNVLKRAGVDERGIRRSEEEAQDKQKGSDDGVPHARSNPFEGTQGKALFRRFNASGSGWLTQGEFIQSLSQWTKSHKNLILQPQPSSPAPRDDKAPASSSRHVAGATGDAIRSPSKGGGVADSMGRSPLRASSERPRSASAKHLSMGGGSKTSGEHEALGAAGKLRQRDYEQNIWPTITRESSTKHNKDAHEMLERVRREEAELLKSKLQTIREQEDRLQARNREADRREDEIKVQTRVLEEREALLLGREKFLEDGKAEVALQQKEVEKLTRELQEKIKEVEARGKWLAEQKQVLLEREEQLRKLNADLELPPDLRPGADTASRSDGAVRNSKERMAEAYRDALEQKRRAMGVGRPYSSKVLSAGGVGASREKEGARAGGEVPSAPPLADVSGALLKERLEIADSMQRLDSMMKGLGLPAT